MRAAYDTGFNGSPDSVGGSYTNETGGTWGGFDAPPQASPVPQTFGQRATGGYFNDPTTLPLMNQWSTRMAQLNAPAPGYGDISGIFSSFLKPDPRMDDAISRMFQVSQGRAPSNAYTGQYATATKNRMQELNAEPFSTSDEAALKARFFDSLAQTRDDAVQQVADQMASRGFAPTSGLARDAYGEVSQGYQKARAGQQQALLQYVTDERNRRRDEAVQMSGALAQQGNQDAQLEAQWNAQRAGILGNIASALVAMRNGQMGAAENMASLRRQAYLDDLNRGGLALETSALPSQLADQRMQQLSQLLNGTTDPSQVFNQYLALNQQRLNQQQYSDQNNAALWSGIANAASKIIPAIWHH